MRFLDFKEAKTELSKLQKGNEYLEYKLYWSKEEIKHLKKEIKVLENKQKESNVISISMKKEDVDSIVKKVTENILGKQEHKCTPECFEKHVIKSIQNDYDSIDLKNKTAKHYFLQYWFENLTREYAWLKCLQIINGKIHFK